MILLIWIIFCIFEGVRDALTFSRGVGHFMKQAGIDLHPFLFIYRFCVFCFFSWWIISNGGPTIPVVSLPFLFPFFHEGTYYVARKIIDSPSGYPRRFIGAWFYKSKTTTAKINFGGVTRTLFLLIGIGIYYVATYTELLQIGLILDSRFGLLSHHWDWQGL